MNKKIINLIGYASGAAAASPGCADGPEALRTSSQLAQLAATQNLALDWTMLSPNKALSTSVAIVAALSQQLAAVSEKSVMQHEAFCVIAGDHSSGIGTWSGVAKALRP